MIQNTSTVSTSSPITTADLLSLSERFGAVMHSRIIVDFPFAGDRVFYRESDRLMVIGVEAWLRIRGGIALTQDDDSIGVLRGIEIEPFGTRADHRDLAIGIVKDIVVAVAAESKRKRGARP